MKHIIILSLDSHGLIPYLIRAVGSLLFAAIPGRRRTSTRRIRVGVAVRRIGRHRAYRSGRSGR